MQIENFLLECAASALRPRTIKERRIQLESLQRHLNKPIETATRADLVKWLARPGLAPSTRQHYRATIKQFFTWLQDEGHRPDNPAARLPKVHVVAPEPTPVETEQIAELLKHVYWVTRVKIILYAYQGLRASEIAAVHGQDIDHAAGTITIPESKGGRMFTRPMHPLVAELARVMPRDGYWFPSRKGGHVTGNSVSRVISAAMRRCGIDHTAHNLRAWHATMLLQSGIDSETVRYSMRHTDTRALQRYAIPSVSQCEDALSVLPVVPLPDRVVRPRQDSNLRHAA